MYAHVPVLLDEVILALKPFPGGMFIDGTLGGGGHAFALLESVPDSRVLGIDADDAALAHVTAEMKRRKISSKRLTLAKGNFRDLGSIAAEHHIEAVDGALFDFGFSSGAMANPERGLSFQKDGPLDMRFDQSSDSATAADLVNGMSARELTECIATYGEDRNAKRIADAIVGRRKKHRFTTTKDLADAIEAVVPRRFRIHPATRTFQALRIAVNDELGAIAAMLPQAIALLKPGGLLLTISFHSLEDRIVKRFAKEEAVKGVVMVVTKRVVKSTDEEVRKNPRSRSAHMRIIKKRNK
jgi:16S rRNA (cytosine1402-N4)-methyltransferase